MALDAFDTPWHPGERRLQARAGSEERLAEVGRRVLRDHMPEQHRSFFEQLPFLVVGTIDAAGRPWATLLEGRPGFVQSPTSKRLRIDATWGADDPAWSSRAPSERAGVGVLGIELPTRRRNRANGLLSTVGGALELDVVQSFGNCPQYIHPRTPRFVREPGTPPPARAVETTSDARAVIANADTLFVCTGVRDEPRGTWAADVSHRGGRAGFVDVGEQWLTIPDYPGNNFFNTLGNIEVYPRAGLLFVDFSRGDVVQVSGEARLRWDGVPELGGERATERSWQVRMDHVVWRPDALALRFEPAGR
jgi:predicted pyridoxine 5'-phosphate oxidase superfamily flavin-nucleotide-binding protein